MPIETTLLALPVTDLAIIGGLALFCIIVGWQVRRLASRGHEAELKRSILEAKGAIPQLESAVRNREQRADTLAVQVKELKERIAEHQTSERQKELEISKRERDIRSLTSELKVIKDGSANSGQVLSLDGEDEAPNPAHSSDPELAKRYAALEARYDAMAKGLFQRDDRITELEEQLKNPDSTVPTRTLEQELAEAERGAEALRDSLKEREEQVQVLQGQLAEEVSQREALEDLAKRRSEGKRELKAAAAKFEQQIPALKQEVTTVREQLAEREGKLVAVTRKFKDERQQREARDAQIAELGEQANAMTARKRALEQRLHEQEEAQRALQAELKGTTAKLASTAATVQERDATIADIERKLADAAERTEASERIAATLQSTIKDRDFKIAELDGELSARAGQLAEQRQLREGREAEIVDLKEHARTAASRQHDLEERLQQQTEAQRALQNELAGARASLSTTEDSARERESALAAAEARIAEAEERTAAAEQAALARQEALQTTIQERDAQVAELEAAAEQQTAKLEMLRGTFFEAKSDHKKHLAELKSRADQQRQALDQLTAAHQRLQEETSTYQTRIAQLEQAFGEQEARGHELEQRLTDADRQNQTLDAVAAEKQRLEQTAAAEQARVAELQEQVTEREAQLLETEQLLAAAGAQSQALSELATAREQLAQEATAQQARIAELEQALAESHARAQAAEPQAAPAMPDDELTAYADAQATDDAQACDAAREVAEAQALAIAEAQADALAAAAVEIGEHTESGCDAEPQTLSETNGAHGSESTDTDNHGAELQLAREAAAAMASQVDELSESLERSNAALRQSQCAIMLLVAQQGTSPLMLPAPVAAAADDTAGDLEGFARANVA